MRPRLAPGHGGLLGFGDTTARRHVIVLRQIMAAAVRDGRLGRNVAVDVQLPPENARRMRFLTADQLADVADAIRPVHYRPAALTLGWVGLRWGELAGRRPGKLNLIRRKITVDEQLTEVGAALSTVTKDTGWCPHIDVPDRRGRAVAPERVLHAVA